MTLVLADLYDKYRDYQMTEEELAHQRINLAYGNAAEEDDDITTIKSLSETASDYGSNGLPQHLRSNSR